MLHSIHGEQAFVATTLDPILAIKKPIFVVATILILVIKSQDEKDIHENAVCQNRKPRRPTLLRSKGKKISVEQCTWRLDAQGDDTDTPAEFQAIRRVDLREKLSHIEAASDDSHRVGEGGRHIRAWTGLDDQHCSKSKHRHRHCNNNIERETSVVICLLGFLRAIIFIVDEVEDKDKDRTDRREGELKQGDQAVPTLTKANELTRLILGELEHTNVESSQDGVARGEEDELPFEPVM